VSDCARSSTPHADGDGDDDDDDARDGDDPPLDGGSRVRVVPRSTAGRVADGARESARASDARSLRTDDLRRVDPARRRRGGGAFGAENGGEEVF